MMRRFVMSMRFRWRWRRLRAGVLSAGLLALSARAVAQPSAGERAEASRAHALDEQGTRLMDEGRYAEACPKLEQSARAAAGTGVLLRLALCFEKLGKTASAWRTYLGAEELARTTGQAKVAELAARRAAAIAASVPRLQVRVPEALSEAALVQLDGRAVAEVVWRGAFAVDPGSHELAVSAPGQRRFETEFEATPGSQVVIAVQFVPAPPPVSSAQAAHGSAREPRGSSARSRAARPDASSRRARAAAQPEPLERGWTMRHTATVTAHGVGLSGFIVGSVFGLSALANIGQAQERCPERVNCDDESMRLQEEAGEDATWSTVGFAVGGAGVIAGAILWWTLPDSKPASKASWTLAPDVGAGMGGVTARGSW